MMWLRFAAFLFAISVTILAVVKACGALVT
jgi:hypothetical protein